MFSIQDRQVLQKLQVAGVIHISTMGKFLVFFLDLILVGGSWELVGAVTI